MVAIRKIDAFLLLSVHFEDLRTQNGEICEWSDGRFRFYFSVKRASNNPHMGVGYCTVDGSTVQSTVDSCTFDGEDPGRKKHQKKTKTTIGLYFHHWGVSIIKKTGIMPHNSGIMGA